MSSISKPMSQFLCKAILFGSCNVRALAETSSSVCYSLRWFSVSSSSDKEQSFIVSYLINSLGFSPKAALSASKHVNFDSPEKPDKAIEFFKGYGFTHTQIASLVRAHPKLLTYDAEKTILPKLEFLATKGISGPQLAKRLSTSPIVLTAGLATQIVPAYNFFRDLIRSDKTVAAVITRSPDILVFNVEKHLSPNLDTLRQHGVARPRIVALINLWPLILVTSPVQFRSLVEKTVEMGFDPLKYGFVQALCAMHLKIGKKSKWERKANAYKAWGWSDGEVLRAFQKNPNCMLISEKKIMALTGFFTSKMGLQPCDVVKCTRLYSYSLEKRIIPRVSFYQALSSRGLVEKEVNVSTLVTATEKMFLLKFVAPFAEKAPELVELYKEKSAQ